MDREKGWCCQIYGPVNGAMWLRIWRWRDCNSSEAAAAAEARHESGKME